MDEELKSLALLALRNAFYEDFSALVNAYVKAAAGLDTSNLEMQLAETASVYGRDTEAEGDDVFMNIWSQRKHGTTGHQTMIEALEMTEATEVHLAGRKVFERRKGEWYFVGDQNETN